MRLKPPHIILLFIFIFLYFQIYLLGHWTNRLPLPFLNYVSYNQNWLNYQKESSYETKPFSHQIYWVRECGCTGLGIEAEWLVYALYKLSLSSPTPLIDIRLSKCEHICTSGFPPEVIEMDSKLSVVSEPDEFDYIILHYAHRGVCPNKVSKKYQYLISRTMYEADRIDEQMLEKCNSDTLNQIWVPTEFNFKSFTKSGVSDNKIKKLPLTIDTSIYSPYSPYISENNEWKEKIQCEWYKYLSIFKWEDRKNWKTLISAFIELFQINIISKSLKSCLIILTKPIQKPITSIEIEIFDFLKSKYNITREMMEGGRGSLLESIGIFLILKEIELDSMIRLYNYVDSFVLPTRCEGWGLPIIEAMSMGLPVIVTNWGGSTEYITSDNSFPIEIEGYEKAFPQSFPFSSLSPQNIIIDNPNHSSFPLWSNPSLSSLKLQMKKVMESPILSKEIGMKGRETIVNNYDIKIVAKLFLNAFHQTTTQQ